jgi:hypothetical protein
MDRVELQADFAPLRYPPVSLGLDSKMMGLVGGFRLIADEDHHKHFTRIWRACLMLQRMILSGWP